MKRNLSLLLLVSTIFFPLTACTGTPAVPATLALPVVTEIPAPTEIPALSAVLVDDFTVLSPLPAEKVLSFGTIVPIGIATNTEDGIGITFYGPDGIVLGEVRTRSQAGYSPTAIHVAGSYTGALDFPLVFYFSENNQGNLWVCQNGQITPLVEVQTLSGLIGVPGQPFVAYASMEPQDSGLLRTRVFLGDLSSLPEASPVLIYNSAESRTVVPVMIRVQDGIATGLWYTLRPWGIGGEIVFEPNEGLYYFDFQDRVVYEVFPKDLAFSALSQDQTWLAYSTRDGNHSFLNLRNLLTGQDMGLPQLPDSDRGAGNAVFSTSNMLAWLEVRGSLADDTFFTTIRVTNEEGTFQQDYPQTQFYKAAGLGDQVSVKPVGWLDEQTFLVQVSTLGKDSTSVIVRVNIGSGEISALAPGIFVGFLHHP